MPWNLGAIKIDKTRTNAKRNFLLRSGNRDFKLEITYEGRDRPKGSIVFKLQSYSINPTTGTGKWTNVKSFTKRITRDVVTSSGNFRANAVVSNHATC